MKANVDPSQTRLIPRTRIRFCRTVRGNSRQEYTGTNQNDPYYPDALTIHPLKAALAERQLALPSGVSLVRYQLMVVQGVTLRKAVSRFQGVAIVMALMAACYFLFQIKERFAVLEGMDERRSQSLADLTQAFRQNNAILDGNKDELLVLTRYLAANATTNSRIASAEERESSRLDKALAIIEQPQEAKGQVGESSPTSPPALEVGPVPPLVEDYPHFDVHIPPIPGAVVHRKKTGEADYWLVQRPDKAEIAARVIPFAIIGTGVAVHSIDDDHDYIITMSGEWLNYGS